MAPLVGFETQTEPAEVEPGSGGGTGAGAGKGAVPVVGPALICTWTLGQVLALPPLPLPVPPLPPLPPLPGLLPPAVGVEDGPGVVEEPGLPPQAVSTASKITSKIEAMIAPNGRLWLRDTGTHLRLCWETQSWSPDRFRKMSD